MASIFKRKTITGSTWRAVIRLKGFPTTGQTFDRKQEAEDWANETERKIKSGRFNFSRHKNKNTFSLLMERYTADGALEHHRSVRDTLRHLEYWNQRIGSYALCHINSELISKERKCLLETDTTHGKKRTPGTVNRYFSTLSSILTYAVKHLHWIDQNPCNKLLKLKESSGRDRYLSDEEAILLLQVCKEHHHPYIYAIVLIALTTGAGKGEILGLQWDDIDFESQMTYVKVTKNGRPRSLPLVDVVIQELNHLKKLKKTHHTCVFPGQTAFRQLDIRSVWSDIPEQANIQSFKFHDLRHSFATFAARQGASNLELATAMGHRSLQMLQRYSILIFI